MHSPWQLYYLVDGSPVWKTRQESLDEGKAKGLKPGVGKPDREAALGAQPLLQHTIPTLQSQI